MDISSLDIPNIKTTKVGSGRNRIEMVEAVIRLDGRLSREALGEQIDNSLSIYIQLPGRGRRCYIAGA